MSDKCCDLRCGPAFTRTMCKEAIGILPQPLKSPPSISRGCSNLVPNGSLVRMTSYLANWILPYKKERRPSYLSFYLQSINMSEEGHNHIDVPKPIKEQKSPYKDENAEEKEPPQGMLCL